MSEEDVYRKLQQHLDDMPVGFPATRSGIEIRILKYFFTPEEAEIATKLTLDFEPIESIYERFKDVMTIRELEKHLENMMKKGGLECQGEGDKKYYANALFVVGMYEHKVTHLEKEFLSDILMYGAEGFAKELFRQNIPQLRTIPVEQSIKKENWLADYDDIIKIVENSNGPFAVQECICRKGKEMFGQQCLKTSRKETCMGMGDGARLYIDQGWAREVSKEEFLVIIRKNQEEGLVLQPGNHVEDLHFICCCCGCCCGILSNVKIFSKPSLFYATNHHAEVNPEACIGCGTCIDECPMNALNLIDDISTVNIDRCIGCGVCVSACPEGAIELKKKDLQTVPPKNRKELHEKILKNKQEIIQLEMEKKEKRRKKRQERKKT